MRLRHYYYPIVVALFLVGFALRWRYLSKIPMAGETVDEYAWTWSGLSLLLDGVPRAWSFLPAYGLPHWHFWHNYNFPMVSPWLDHPPLFSLVMGKWMRVAGFKDLYRVDLHYMRCFPVWMFAVAFGLLVAILPRYFERGPILLGLLAFATSPMATINQRLVVSENFFTVLFLLCIFCMHQLSTRKIPYKAFIFFVILLLSIALPLSKLAAVGLSASLILWALMAAEWLAAALVVVGTGLGLYAFVRYGQHFNKELFWAVLKAHRGRFSGFGGAAKLATQWELVSVSFGYYPFLVALIGIGEGLFEERTRPFFAHYLVYLGVMTFLVDDRTVYGWYVLPMLPALCCGLGLFTWRMLTQPLTPRFLLWGLFCLPYMAQVLLERYPKHDAMMRYGYAGAFAMVVGVFCLATRWPRAVWFTRATMVFALAGLTICDIQYLIWRWPLSGTALQRLNGVPHF